MRKSLSTLFSFSSLLLRLNCSNLLANLLRVVQYHGRALACDGRYQNISAICLNKLASGVVAPAMDIASSAPIGSLTCLPVAHCGVIGVSFGGTFEVAAPQNKKRIFRRQVIRGSSE